MRNPPQRWEPRRYRSYRGFGFGLSPVLVIIIINFLLFIATVMSRELIFQLGLVPAYVGARPWTVLTSMFLHAGFWHLFGNMITFYFFGNYLARMVGNGRFLLVYFVGGIVGNLLFAWLGVPLSIAVGASGAVYAVAGALVVMRPNVRVLLYFIIPMPLWVVVPVFFVVFSFISGIAWQAHLGGLIVGLVAGYFFRKRECYHY